MNTSKKIYAFKLFQFHEGPIKTFVGAAVAMLAAAFQFHEGPIKTDTNTDLPEHLYVSIP